MSIIVGQLNWSTLFPKPNFCWVSALPLSEQAQLEVVPFFLVKIQFWSTGFLDREHDLGAILCVIRGDIRPAVSWSKACQLYPQSTGAPLLPFPCHFGELDCLLRDHFCPQVLSAWESCIKRPLSCFSICAKPGTGWKLPFSNLKIPYPRLSWFPHQVKSSWYFWSGFFLFLSSKSGGFV